MGLEGDIIAYSGGGTPPYSPKGSAKKSKSDEHVQHKINLICSVLKKDGIQNAAELNKAIKPIMEKLGAASEIFANHTASQLFTIFKKAVDHLNHVDDQVHITISKVDENKFLTALQEVKAANLFTIQSPDAQSDDLSRITRSYDRLKTSIDQVNKTSKALEKQVQEQEYSVCKNLIIGGGDTATHLWLEKYKDQHGHTHDSLAKGQLPDTLALAEGTGSWLHDYTLAQPHNLLERGEVSSNPSDFTKQESYDKNPYVNARHLYQANIINMAHTDAPLLLGSSVLAIEKRENHTADWKSAGSAYRVSIELYNGQKKIIYTNEVDVCAGLGAPKTIFPGEYMSPEAFEALSKFDNEQLFTPIVDGNQFMLTGIEEQAREKRTILVYGGGGNATACYRKGFFGGDKGSKTHEFSETNQKNDMRWIARDNVDTAGYGKLVKEAVTHATGTNELLGGTLRKVEFDPDTKKLKLLLKISPLKFQGKEIPNDMRYLSKVPGPHEFVLEGKTVIEDDWYALECDQLVYSIGQESSRLESISSEIMDDLELDANPDTKMPIGIKSSDDKIHFFGAAALSISGRKWPYSPETRRWAVESRIPRDAEWPGVMPPSRAQIKEHALTVRQRPVTHVNSNADSITSIGMLLKNAGVKSDDTIMSFINDLLIKRHDTDSGLTKKTLEALIVQYNLQNDLEIHGHGILALKKKIHRSSSV